MSLDLQNIDAVLFDLDGTLLDSAPDLAHAANQLRLERNMQALPLVHYRPFVGTGARGMLRIALDIQSDASNFEQLKEEFFLEYERCMGRHSHLFEGVAELLVSLQNNGKKWGIVTNKSERFALPIVQNCSALENSKAVICGDTISHSKPHPAPLLEAAKRLGVNASRCIYVGDDERDMIAARAAGMQSVAAEYGYLGEFESVAAWNPDAIIKLPADLQHLLQMN